MALSLFLDSLGLLLVWKKMSAAKSNEKDLKKTDLNRPNALNSLGASSWSVEIDLRVLTIKSRDASTKSIRHETFVAVTRHDGVSAASQHRQSEKNTGFVGEFLTKRGEKNIEERRQASDQSFEWGRFERSERGRAFDAFAKIEIETV